MVEQTKASKIVIVGPASTLDCGEMAMLATTVISLSSLVPNARFVMCSLYWENDFKWYKRILSKKYNLKVIGTFIPPSVRVLRYLFLLLRHIPEYLTSEIIVCIPGDGYSDLISGGLGSCFFSARLLLGAFLRKPTVLYAVSIGPFLSKLTRLVARLALNKTSLILAREESTKDYLLQLGVAKAHIQVTADSAFLLSPSPPERVKEILKDEGIIADDRKVIGVATSQVIHLWAFQCYASPKERYESYIKAMSSMCDYLVGKFGLNSIILLIPHAYGIPADDRVASREIYQRVREKENVKVIKGRYTPAEIKGMISLCDMFVSSKMHPAIAATSMLIPTIAMSYSHKVDGLIGKELHQEECIIDVRNLNFDTFLSELLLKIDYVWSNREKIHNELKAIMETIVKKALLNAELTVELLNSRSYASHYSEHDSMIY